MRYDSFTDSWLNWVIQSHRVESGLRYRNTDCKNWQIFAGEITLLWRALRMADALSSTSTFLKSNLMPLGL